MMIIETVVNILVAVEEYNVHKDYAIMDWVISPYYGLLIHLWVVTKLYNSQVVRDLWSSQWDKEMVGMGLRQGPRGVQCLWTGNKLHGVCQMVVLTIYNIGEWSSRGWSSLVTMGNLISYLTCTYIRWQENDLENRGIYLWSRSCWSSVIGSLEWWRSSVPIGSGARWYYNQMMKGGAYMWSGEVEISGVTVGVDLDVVGSGVVCDWHV